MCLVFLQVSFNDLVQGQKQINSCKTTSWFDAIIGIKKILFCYLSQGLLLK